MAFAMEQQQLQVLAELLVVDIPIHGTQLLFKQQQQQQDYVLDRIHALSQMQMLVHQQQLL